MLSKLREPINLKCGAVMTRGSLELQCREDSRKCWAPIFWEKTYRKLSV